VAVVRTPSKTGRKGHHDSGSHVPQRTETTDQSNTTDEARKLAGFRAVYVWDQQQTTGKELPQIGSVTGDPSFYLARLEEFVRARGIRLDYSADIAPARGMAEKGKITLLPDQTPAETFATLVHELAHSDMHFGERRADTNKRVRETEAESVAYVVCSAIGLETGTARRITSACTEETRSYC